MITIHDVARAAQVSVATASKALSPNGKQYRISQDCRDRVMAVCRELGYRPSHLARCLQSGKALAIGSLLGDRVHSLENAPLWSVMHAGMTAAALHRGFQLVVLGAQQGESPIENGVKALEERRIDGLAVPSFLLTTQVVRRLEEVQAPVVLMDWPKSTEVPEVEVDDTVGVLQAVEHLAALGHRRYLWVAPGVTRDYYENRRRNAFMAALDERGLTAHKIEVGYSLKRMIRKEDQIAATRAALLAAPRSGFPGATAVVAYNEAMALGVYAAAAERGLRVPDDLSVVSFDDVFAVVAYPPMTVVSLMMYDLGVRTVEVLLEMASDAAAWSALRGSRHKIPCQLVVRGSTAPAK